MNGLIGLAGTLALLLTLGAVFGLADRRNFSVRWLIIAAMLVAINDALLTLGYGWLPDVVGGTWNWQGKLMALAASIAIIALPAFGWRQTGLTISQEAGSLKAAVPVAAVYCAFFVVIALLFPAEPATAEDVAFQLTMPGLEEELFYRGLLLFALDQAFRGRKRLLGVDWGWGAVLSCMLFGLTHAFGYSDGAFSFDPVTMALTAIPSLIAVWLRLRTGSLLLPVLLHNFGNTLSFIV
jgi:membrane protease YdiL (CAAX protease family)